MMAVPTGPADTRNTQALGAILYTHYAFVFQAAGLILLIAMIGAIVLTHRQRPGIRRQKIALQNARTDGADDAGSSGGPGCRPAQR